MSLQWLFRFGSPKWFYEKTTGWVFWLGVIALTMLVIGTIWSLGFTPPHKTQDEVYRIIYIHVPAAFLSEAAYLMMAVAGGVGLIWRTKLSFLIMHASAPIGAMLAVFTLATGAIWGKPTWGTYWFWDARLTSMLILLFLYLGVIALRHAYSNPDVANKTCAILALVGTVNIPIIKFSVNWWYTLHQPATLKITEKPEMATSMLFPLLFMILAFWIAHLWLVLMHSRVEILKQEKKSKWVKALVEKE